MKEIDERYEWGRSLVAKLERLSADSIWAHRASGLRGALLRALAEYEQVFSVRSQHPDSSETQRWESLDRLIAAAFDILEKAAKEIPVPEDWLKDQR